MPHGPMANSEVPWSQWKLACLKTEILFKLMIRERARLFPGPSRIKRMQSRAISVRTMLWILNPTEKA